MVTYAAASTATNAAHPVNCLVVTRRSFPWFRTLELTGKFTLLENELRILGVLAKDSYDIIFIDLQGIETDLLTLIKEIRFRSSETVISLIVDSGSLEFHAKVLEAGASDILLADITEEAFAYRLQVLMLQKAKLQEIQHRTHILHAVSMLTQQFHTTEHPMVFIVESIEALCRNLGMTGTAMVIKQGEVLHLYAGTITADNRPRFFESPAKVHPYNPLSQVIQSGVSMIIPDVSKHPYYAPVPIIQDPRSALIIPLKQGSQIIGSLALFSAENSFSSDDLAPYELLATHLAKAYFNVRHNYDRETDIFSTRQVVRVWQTLSLLHSSKEIVKVLHELLTDIKDISHAAVWLLTPKAQTYGITIYTEDPRLVDMTQKLFDDGELDKIMGELDSSMSPITFHDRQVAKTRLAPVLDIMGSTVTLAPIVGTTLLGGIFFSTVDGGKLAANDQNLLESITHTAAQIIERNMIIRRMLEHQSRLESVLRSIHEGIFFVDDQGNVILCNPQFTELSSITPSQVIGKTYLNLLRLLASNTETPDESFEQLRNALDQILVPSTPNEEYPILELWNASLESYFTVEFARLDISEDDVGWIGYIRKPEPSENLHATAELNSISGIQEVVLVQMMELQSHLLMLRQQYTVLKPQLYLQMVERAEQHLHKSIQVWNNYLELEKFISNSIQLQLEETEPVEFIESSLNSRLMANYRASVTVNSKPPRVMSLFDARFMNQAVDNIIQFILHHKQGNTPIQINVVPERNHILMNFQERNSMLDEEKVASVFDMALEGETITERSLRVGMNLSKQIVEAHGGDIQVDQRRGLGLTITITLPIVGSNDMTQAQSEEAIPKQSSGSQGLNVMIVESSKRLLANHYDTLAANVADFITENDLSDAIMTLKITHVDVLMLEADKPKTNISGLCQSIRKYTDTPILIVATPELESECVHALMNGADAYLMTPLDRSKLLAQLKAIAKRKDIDVRTAAPIQIGELYIDLARRRVYLGNNVIDLTAKQYDILTMLVLHRDQVLTYSDILTRVWGAEYREEKNYLWVNVSRLRRKLEPTDDSPRYIYTQQGVGYIFHEP